MTEKTLNTLETELKELIIDALSLEDISVEDIESEEPLFDGGLMLDSIDALELGLSVQKTYNLQFKSDDKDIQKHFYSVSTLAQFVLSETN